MSFCLVAARDYAKGDHFSCSSKYVYETANEGEFLMAEILSTSNTGSMPAENPQLGFSGMLPTRKQVLILLAWTCHKWASLFLHRHNLKRMSWVAMTRSVFWARSNRGQKSSVLIREGQGKTRKRGRKQSVTNGQRLVTHGWRQWWRLGQIARDQGSVWVTWRSWQVLAGAWEGEAWLWYWERNPAKRLAFFGSEELHTMASEDVCLQNQPVSCFSILDLEKSENKTWEQEEAIMAQRFIPVPRRGKRWRTAKRWRQSCQPPAAGVMWVVTPLETWWPFHRGCCREGGVGGGGGQRTFSQGSHYPV